MKRQSVVVTGIGPISSIGVGKEELWRALRSGVCGVKPSTHLLNGEAWGRFPVAKIESFRPEACGLDPHLLRAASWHKDDSRDFGYLLAACKLAMDDSCLCVDADHNDVGLVLACENAGIDHLIEQLLATTLRVADGGLNGNSKTKRGLAEELYEQFEKKVYGVQTFMYLHRISKALRLHGPSYFINNACASGLFAVELGSQLIRSGTAAAVVVGAGDAADFMTKYLWFSRRGLYADDGFLRPFERNRTGTVFGDGAAAVVLESRRRAEQRGAHIYAEYLGGGFTQDAWKVAVPSVEPNFYELAFLKALSRAGVSREEIDVVCAHGCGTKLGDKHEALTLTSIFGRRPARPVISALKPFVGHNLGGSALVELSILMLLMQRNWLPRTPNFVEEDEELGIAPVTEPIDATIELAAKAACGFGGYNAVGIFKNVGR